MANDFIDENLCDVLIHNAPLRNTFNVIDDFGPIRPRIDPTNRAAPRALKMRADIVPAPVGESIEWHFSIVPAAGAGIAVGRADAVDKDSP